MLTQLTVNIKFNTYVDIYIYIRNICMGSFLFSIYYLMFYTP